MSILLLILIPLFLYYTLQLAIYAIIGVYFLVKAAWVIISQVAKGFSMAWHARQSIN